MKLKRAWLVFAALVALGCAGRQMEVLTNVDPSFDFSKPRTYKWQDTRPEELLKNIFPAPGVQARDFDASLKAAADAELQEKGFERSDTGELVFTYAVTTADKQASESTPGAAAWEPSKDADFDTAVLALDILDPATNVRVWRGAAMMDFRRGEGPEKVGNVIRRILEEYPPRR